MEGNKLEISGRVLDDPPPATFKSISESDTEETALQESKISPKTTSKSLNSFAEVDGADEKMLASEEKSLAEDSKIDVADVKFTINDKQNGDAKLDIAELKSAFVGMGKEELMKYANDPFWVRLRWILFVSFWLIWLAMLVGAVLIIIAAPKCAPPAPRTWWERGPLTEVSIDTDSHNLEQLKKNKIQGVIISNPLDSYKAVNESIDILDFLKIAKEKDMNVIISLNPTTTDAWFSRSENKDEDFVDYYIWADQKSHDTNGFPVAPNNWLSPKDGSAWKYSTKREQFYYSPDSIPHLNFRHPKVVDEFTSVLRQWVEVGVKGFQLRGVPSLLVDENFHNESVGTVPGKVHTEYEFYNHARTVNVNGIGAVLKQWRKVVKNNTEDSGLFMLAEDLTSIDAFLVNESLTIDLPKHSKLFTTKDRVSTAENLYNGLNSAFTILGDNWPLWQYVESSLPTDVMNILTMLLPGSTLVDQDVEIDPQLLNVRDVPSVMFGSCHRELLANGTVFAYLRVQAGNPGYLVACNPSDKLVTVDFRVMHNVSDEITIQVLSSNYSIPDIEPSLKVPSNAFKMPPKSAAVLTYVPK